MLSGAVDVLLGRVYDIMRAAEKVAVFQGVRVIWLVESWFSLRRGAVSGCRRHIKIGDN